MTKEPVRNTGRSFNGSKTHCKRGHEYTPENTLIYAGRRNCRACARIRSSAYYARRRAAVANASFELVE